MTEQANRPQDEESPEDESRSRTTREGGDGAAGIPGKPTEASRTTLSHIMTGSDTNLLGTVHGGVIMKLVDDAAGAVAGRHSGGPAVTASMDEMVFLEPVRVGDLVHVRAQVNWTGRSSMEVGVRVMAERWNESTPAQQVGSAYLVFAAVDADGRPRPVPPVLPGTERDERRYQEAQIRRTHRLARRRAIKELREKRAADGIDEG
ncbi:acyl-CoA thioesterase [Streptomyces sp. NBC_01218]|uniref:acyl-CoA thioesterase n=1 Tax=unclassified Streptomyces TaxID=2593676 RepID=UPI0023BA360C|nr:MULTISPECIES: acyl-CoA thioesterase [unclassified Streptomyces]WEH41518.1 acyl-CoA thioesterase [Streptomyces sp. AM 2-1-1]WSQ53147.1 acyl-CoA thioesterase [Streptomyces sp. NBC_01218]